MCTILKLYIYFYVWNGYSNTSIYIIEYIHIQYDTIYTRIINSAIYVFSRLEWLLKNFTLKNSLCDTRHRWLCNSEYLMTKGWKERCSYIDFTFTWVVKKSLFSKGIAGICYNTKKYLWFDFSLISLKYATVDEYVWQVCVIYFEINSNKIADTDNQLSVWWYSTNGVNALLLGTFSKMSNGLKCPVLTKVCAMFISHVTCCMASKK